MGLDMWFFAKAEKESKVDPVELAYWRKHNALHDWFAQRAIAAGLVETRGDFNTVEVPLTTELLDDLEKDIKSHKLRPTGGFFFGTTDYDPAEEAESDLAYIERAREALAEGQYVYYDSWW